MHCTTYLIPVLFLVWFGFADALPATFVSTLAGDYKMRSPVSLMSKMIMILRGRYLIPVTCERNLIPCDWLLVVTVSALLLMFI